MRDLVGAVKVPGQTLQLPAPLDEGVPPRVENGVPLYNPDWEQNVSFPLNHEYLEAVVNRVVTNQNVSGPCPHTIRTVADVPAHRLNARSP